MLVLTAFILEQMISQALFLALFVATFDSLLNNRALCFSTSVNSVCSSDSEKFGLLFSAHFGTEVQNVLQLRTK